MVLLLTLAAGPSLHAQLVDYGTRTLAGDSIRIGAGEPATLVAVFATWCVSCKSDLRILDSLRAPLSKRGVRVIAISVDDAGDSVVARYMSARRTGLVVAHDGSGRVSKTFGATGVPETFLIDTNGRARWRGRGELNPRDAKFLAALGSIQSVR